MSGVHNLDMMPFTMERFTEFSPQIEFCLASVFLLIIVFISYLGFQAFQARYLHELR